jgi:hypothetical protein
MYGHVTSGRPPASQPIDSVLGHQLSPLARRFTEEHAEFLLRVDFEDIASHPLEELRSAEAYCSCDGLRHTIWLDRESPDFEGLMMHHAMRGILMERGFPKTICPPAAIIYPFLRYLSSLLASAITDPVIDRWLMQGGFGVYDREILTHRATADLWLDARRGTPRQHGFLFCKWTLLAVLLRLDPTFEGGTVHLLYALIRKKFPEPWEVAETLSASIRKEGFAEPYLALRAMLELRNALNLQSRIPVIDGEGRRY